MTYPSILFQDKAAPADLQIPQSFGIATLQGTNLMRFYSKNGSLLLLLWRPGFCHRLLLCVGFSLFINDTVRRPAIDFRTIATTIESGAEFGKSKMTTLSRSVCL